MGQTDEGLFRKLIHDGQLTRMTLSPEWGEPVTRRRRTLSGLIIKGGEV